MSSPWPSLSFLLVLIVFWLLFRLYAWRTTLSTGLYVMFFVFGCVGSVLVALYLQAVPIHFPLEEGGLGQAAADPKWWLLGPVVEEFAKALPVIILAFFLPVSRRLSIADFALVGFSTGMGFAFVEGNLGGVMAAGNALVPAAFQHLLGLGYTVDTRTYSIFWAGHYAYPALVGVGAGLGVRFLPRGSRAVWVPAALLFALAAFDHSMLNFKLSHVWPNTFTEAPAYSEALYRFTLHGYLAIVLLPALLICGSWVEGFWCWRFVKSPEQTRLPGEFRPLVLSEFVLAIRRLRLGWQPFALTMQYFAHRRGLTIAAAEAAADPNDAGAAAYLQYSHDRLIAEQPRVADPVRSGWIQPKSVLLGTLRTFVTKYSLVLILLVVAAFVFMMPPDVAPFFHSNTFAIAIALVASGFTLWRVLAFRRRPKPDSEHSDGEVLTAYHARAMMLSSSAVTAGIPLLAIFVNRSFLIPVSIGYVSKYLGDWMTAGGNPISLMGIGSLTGTVEPIPTPKDKCAEERATYEAFKRGADDAKIDAEKLRAKSDAASAPCREARAAALAAENELEAIDAPVDETSYVEDAQTGRRVTVGDSRLLRAAAHDAWLRYRRGELTAAQLEDEWNNQNDPAFLDQLRERDRQTRDARRAAAQQRLTEAQAQQEQACTPELDQLDDKASAAENFAVRIWLKAGAALEALQYCEGKAAAPAAPAAGDDPKPFGAPTPLADVPDEGGIPKPPVTPAPDADPCRYSRLAARNASVATENAYAAAKAAVQTTLDAFHASDAANSPEGTSKTMKEQVSIIRQVQSLDRDKDSLHEQYLDLLDHRNKLHDQFQASGDPTLKAQSDQVGAQAVAIGKQVDALDDQRTALVTRGDELSHICQTLWSKALTQKRHYDDLVSAYDRLNAAQISTIQEFNGCQSVNPGAGPAYAMPDRVPLPTIHTPPTPEFFVQDDGQTDEDQ